MRALPEMNFISYCCSTMLAIGRLIIIILGSSGRIMTAKGGIVIIYSGLISSLLMKHLANNIMIKIWTFM